MSKVELKDFTLLKQGIDSNWKTNYEIHKQKLISTSKENDLHKLEICIYYLGYVYDMIPISMNDIELLMTTFVNVSCNLNYVFTTIRNYSVKITYYTRLFENDVKNKLTQKDYYCILSGLLFYNGIELDTKERVIDELKILFYQTFDFDTFLASSITDIFLLKNIPEGNEFLRLLRARNNTITDIKRATIYEDNQNVHNSWINKELRVSACRLIEVIGSNDVCIDDIINELKYYNDINIINSILKRIQTDNVLFTHNYIENENTKNKESDSCIVYFNLYTILSNVWKFIMISPHKKELKEIFYNELKSANNVCSSGVLARLMSVIQGFTDDKLLTIQINSYEHIKSKLIPILNNLLKSMKEEYLFEMVNDNNSIFVKEFIKMIDFEVITKTIDVGIEEYYNVLKIIIGYCKNDNIMLVNGKLGYYENLDSLMEN